MEKLRLYKIESYIGVNKQFTQKFSYDSIGRLSEAKEYRGDTNALSYKQKFDFDRFGNLYRKTSSNLTTGQATPLPYTPIEESDISKQTNRLTANTIYDDAGNVTNDTKFRHQNSWYDANGRMFRTTSNISDIESNSVYDASGNRVATKVDVVWTFFIYDAFGKMVAEYGGVRAADDGGVKYILQDWQGSSRAIVSNSGFVKARMDYQAFGEEIYANIGRRTTTQGFNATTNLRQKYGLTERDEATGLDHTLWRKNENKAGRWTSPDPFIGSMNLANPQSFNRYSYVENQPTNFVDPSGLNVVYFTMSYCYIVGDVRYCVDLVIHTMNIGGGSPTGGTETGGGGGQPESEKQKECSVEPIKPPTDPVAQRFESGGGNEVDTFSMTLGATQALTCIQGSIRTAGGETPFLPNSGYRPQAYQDHFKEVWAKAQLLKNNTQKECQQVKKQVQNELAKHQIRERPAQGVSNHTRGTAFDISISGVTGKQINAFANQCGLRRGRGHGGGHHFDFVGQEP